MDQRARVVGVGMIPFTTPSRSEPSDVMGERGVRAALADAGVGYSAVQQAHVGYVYGDSTSGQAALYRVGPDGSVAIAAQAMTTDTPWSGA
ncbi:hypothetical protein [Pseudonocardia broussonetiae]|uniref:hypothetical protein n=1 Tax=Pseudonocardia broussonetiae TaxID=2736640 RepID=UPI001964E1C5|nr:hypothetical protein [Pseudonocardia broussonetiae]